ncbi:MAG TPA: D-glycero-beta-D-manno-heptose 1,7-bisphosphate 7-phosphatase [Ktedonobacteraceae bacterium]|nr:D-glycero-beta-D-manno-heptose 1,7-bisphosphate 7-phosphatase [Ktedonobacteraceae bacterium]
MSTIFLDRDGVINENRSDYVKSWSEFRFLPGVCEAIARLTRAGHRIVVCTNQAGVAKGSISKEALEEMHARMVAEIRQGGGEIEKVYYCPHGKEENCRCRKPQPGMLLQATQELGLDLNDAVFIGDSISDIRAGMAIGIHTILVLTGLGLEQFRAFHHEATRPFRIALNLKHAVEYILHGTHVHTGKQTTLERACYAMLTRKDGADLSLHEHFVLATEM